MNQYYSKLLLQEEDYPFLLAHGITTEDIRKVSEKAGLVSGSRFLCDKLRELKRKYMDVLIRKEMREQMKLFLFLTKS